MENANGLTRPVQVYDAEAFGRSMREVGVDFIEGQATDFVSRWFHASKGEVDLVIWSDTKNRVIKIQICVFGQIIEWNPIHGTRTGYVTEFGAADPNTPSEIAEIIRYDRECQTGCVQQAIEILSHCPELRNELRSTIVFNLRESPKMHKRTRERAMKEWSPKIEEIVSDRVPSVWTRLKSWVFGD